jgi:hypothetical protein
LRPFIAGGHSLASIRVVTMTMPAMLQDLVTELIANHRNVDLVARLDNRDFAPSQLASFDPEFLLIGLADGEDDEIGASLASYLPNTKVVAFSSNGRHAFVHEAHDRHTMLMDMSPRQLIDTILGS